MHPLSKPRSLRALRLHSFSLVSVLFIHVAGPAWGAEQIEEIVVTAAPLNRSVDDLTQPALVLTQEALLRKAASSIGETLAGELGVSATYFGPVASRPVIRGQAGPRVSVLEAGISSLDVADLSPDHAVPIEPLFADRIEVIRGPATLLYGSSAAGGVVNIIDNRIPELTRETPLGGALEVRGDSAADERAIAARLDGQISRIGWHLDGFTRDTDDIEIPGFATATDQDRPDTEPRGYVANSASEVSGYAGGISFINDRGSIGVSISRYENTYGIPGPEEEEEEPDSVPIAPGPFIDLEQTRIDLRSEYAFDGPIERARVRFGYNDYEHAEIEPSGEVGTLFENDAWEARVELLHTPLFGWQGAIGLQLNDRDFSALGEEAFVPPTQTRSYGLFALEELPFEKGVIEVGARIESLEHKPANALAGYDENAFSVAAGLKWDLTEHHHDLLLNLSRSQRHPDTAELYANGAHLATGLYEIGLFANGSDDVKKETSTNLDIAIHHQTDTLSWKIGGFYNQIDDYIYRVETSVTEDGFPLAPYVQEDARFYGLEAELTFSPRESPWQARVFADMVRGSTDDGDLPRIQPARFGGRLGYSTLRWSAGFEAIYHAKQNRISSFNTDAYTMLNTDLTFHIGDNGPMLWDVFVKGTNLLDEEARRSTSFRAAYVPLPGVSAHVGIRMRYL
jgi:iron complex outermembrane receptor protein